MRIDIAQRLRPFTHLPGTPSIMPGTGKRIVVYPTMVDQQPLPITGPVQGFTHQLDLERGCVWIFGHAKSGYFRQRISSMPSLPVVERLYLGVDKTQDWELVRRRADPAEYLPFWYRLGQMVPPSEATGGTARFLHEWRQAIQSKDRQAVLEPVRNLFLCGFEGLLAPRLQDTDYNGFALGLPEPTDNPLALLSQGAWLIREMLVSVGEQNLHFLPVLPPEFSNGRLIKTPLGPLTISLEWSKKLLRRLILTTQTVGEWNLQFQTSLRSFRLRHSESDRGERLTCDSWLTLEPGIEYLLDRFEK